MFDHSGPWMNFLWALENPHPKKAIEALRFEPICGTLVISGVSVGDACSMPLRWEKRKKAVLKIPSELNTLGLNETELLSHIRLDLGQIAAIRPRFVYPTHDWEKTRQNLEPIAAMDEFIVEYAAHPDAAFHLADGKSVAARDLTDYSSGSDSRLTPIDSADQRVTLRVVDARTNKVRPVKLHVHGRMGEYLTPLDRMRKPDRQWCEDYSPDFCHGNHLSTYISGVTTIDLPLGEVYIEITNGFEVKPVRTTLEITRYTKELTVEIDKSLRWREMGWVTADTHVHFLSPPTAMLEGAAEGVNVINLLASQWGELMTNVGDFDGNSTFGTKSAGGTGEFLVRVGTENRQHVLGHISLLGYSGNMILPLCAGGPHESAIGDPVDVLITEWAQQCRKQGGLVVMPHFPDPRMENAASIVLGEVDAVEMTTLDDLYCGIDSYSLVDWYRYLNNGYLIPAVAGTDKMSTEGAVGMIRTYAKIPDSREFSYETWMGAVRAGHTFVTTGPLIDLNVDGKAMGSRFSLSSSGGSVDVSWKAASIVVPMTRIELIVNGEVKESRAIRPDEDAGSWSVRIQKSSWIAVVIRAKYCDKPEMIAAHSSPIMMDVEGSQFFAAADALTILDQIEASMAYVDTIGILADVKRYKEMRLLLASAHRRLHNRMHEMGFQHTHTVGAHHSEHD
ncbi:CehA/McbA family metallohydrolase [Mesorhizobium sp.]|uniref:CehA/McbA family metallohydrolase n=1 Tax=Mesorhizobium sp. TaxID=1871066 RepID=UPI000FE5EA3C|nr:CehA/McbA family metallohydrolase [Mesorhizobium sp.]RWA79241.1 MAG: hypothetical protein EOQ32_31965 [Mesorhizobium sp.]